MDMVQKFAIGVLRGMDQQDLADLLKDAPSLLGKKLGRVIKDVVDKGDERISDEKISEIESLIEKEPDEERALVSGVLAQGAKNNKRSRLEIYCDLLNFVMNYMIKHRTAFVLKGFFHKSEVLAYFVISIPWEKIPESESEKLIDAMRVKDIDQRINLVDLPIEISIYDPVNSIVRDPEYLNSDLGDLDEILIELNRRIRKSSGRTLQNSYNIFDVSIGRIFEFYFQKELDYSEKHMEIPDDAPGITDMFISLDTALEAQGAPDKDLNERASMLDIPPSS